MVDALTLRGDERRSLAAISHGEVPSNLWPVNLWMGKPCQIKSGNSKFNVGKYTRGSETSQYPEEKKINKIISLVAASEKEEAQTSALRAVHKVESSSSS